MGLGFGAVCRGVAMAILTASAASAQMGDSALIFCRDGSTCDAGVFKELKLALADVAVDAPQLDHLPPDLWQYRMVFAMAPVNELSGDDESRLVRFWNEGGFLVLAGEASGYSSGASRSFNRITLALNHGSMLEEASYDALCVKRATLDTRHPLNVGVSELTYAYSTGIVGTTLTPVAWGVSGQVLIASAERLLVLSDTNPFSDYCGKWSPTGNARFVQNLWVSATPSSDGDDDGHPDTLDNCPTIYNPDQADTDADGSGDLCDSVDTDMDGHADTADNCPYAHNPDQADLDADTTGDLCDLDDDGDAFPDELDNCPIFHNSGQEDFDRDGYGDLCDADIDGDGSPNVADPCDHDPSDRCLGVGGSAGVGAFGGSAGIGAFGGTGAVGGNAFAGTGPIGGVGAAGGLAGFGATAANGGSGLAGDDGDHGDDFVELTGRGCGCGVASGSGSTRVGLAALFVALVWSRRKQRGTTRRS
jgi:MYXO-CTERM domain-containing protein